MISTPDYSNDDDALRPPPPDQLRAIAALLGRFGLRVCKHPKVAAWWVEIPPRRELGHFRWCGKEGRWVADGGFAHPEVTARVSAALALHALAREFEGPAPIEEGKADA
ncbi:hypothetical protein [Gloeobacter morelensis]|uniref:hypothetical protein n=1 Tax=Gloeobacter morelensis TaxID=2907343 RepID=UPI001E620C6D|nr:hypothetical protein [Gloeobacter morelensis]UFP97182.1 hypothetical protein ISF26_23975 [Gloeobacter morelensis MG652769]